MVYVVHGKTDAELWVNGVYIDLKIARRKMRQDFCEVMTDLLDIDIYTPCDNIDIDIFKQFIIGKISFNDFMEFIDHHHINDFDYDFYYDDDSAAIVAGDHIYDWKIEFAKVKLMDCFME